VLDLETITLATSEDGITIIQTGESRYIYDQTLSELETTLPGNQFFRVSRSAIIRLSAIDTIHPFFNGTFKIQLHNGATVDVSRRRAKDLRQFVDF
jgi:two-component system LytT family response regulator